MTGEVPFKVADVRWLWRGPEVYIRDFDGNGTKDEINAADGTYWRPPVFIGSENQVHVRKTKMWVKKKGDGSRYTKKISQSGYNEIILTFSGEVVDHSWMYYLTDECVTQDNTPSGQTPTRYTHTHDIANALANPPKTFEIVHYFPNDKSGGGESVCELFTGCIAISYEETCETNGIVMGTWTIQASNVITGNKPTTINEYTNTDFFHMGKTTLTWAKGATAFIGIMKAYKFSFKTDKRLDLGGGSFYAQAAKSPNNIDIALDVTVESWEKGIFDRSQEDPLTALDKNLTLKVARDDTIDYHSFVFTHLFEELMDESWNEGNLRDTISIQINPHESGYNFKWITVDTLLDDQFET